MNDATASTPTAYSDTDVHSDAAARERLRTSLDESLWVEAAAGTGKTTVLVERLVAVLASGRGRVDHVVAVTFTRKAAGELKLRLRQQLDRQRRASRDPSAQQNLDHAIAHLEEAQIGTIHGFCAELLRRRPVAAGLDPDFRELEEEQAQALYERAFRRWIERRLEDMPPGLSRALERLAISRGWGDESPIERLRQAGWRLVDWRDYDTPWQRRDFDREGDLVRLVEKVQQLEQLRCQGQRHHPVFEQLEPVAGLAVFIANSGHESIHQLVDDRADELEAHMLALAKELRRFKARGAYQYAPGLPLSTLAGSAQDLRNALADFERQADADLAALLRDELTEVIADYEALKRAAGRVDFLDLLIRSRDLLRHDPEARHDLQASISHLFVDELQDIDPLQAEILLLLVADDPETADWREVRPRPGSLLLVGDPKQSIYRFRRADVVHYQTLRERLRDVGVETLQLSRSFRAVRPLQQAINAAFGQVMREDRRSGQPAYVALEGHRQQSVEQPSLVVLPVPDPCGNVSYPNGRAIEASFPDAAAAYIGWLVNDSGWTVDDPERPGERVAIAPRHICILFRRYTSWGKDVTAPYVRALEVRGLPHLLIGDKTLHQREEVETMRAALRAIEWPDDALAVYATLRGTFFGFTDDVLWRFKLDTGHFDPLRETKRDAEADADVDSALDDDLQEVRDALDTLAELHAERNRIPIAETLHRLLEHSRAHAAFALRPAGHQVLANVQRVADLARAFELRGGLSFRGFVEQLERAAEQASAGSSPVIEEGAEGVRLITVHGAKGLEFPVVMLADLTCNLTGREAGQHLDSSRGLAAVRILGARPWELIDNGDVELERDRAEGARLAYVAATRARDLLVVPGIGSRPWRNGWLGALDDAIYPRGQAAARAPGCPEFGNSTSLRGGGVRPGLHQPRRGDHQVVWWDPNCLQLQVAGSGGVRHSHLLKPTEDDAAERGIDSFLDWQDQRQRALDDGGRPSHDVSTVTELRQDPPTAIEVSVERLTRPAGRPSGRRFGTLVHTVLRDVSFGTESTDVEGPSVEQLAQLHGRLLSATGAEVRAAARAVEATLEHEVITRARQAHEVCRETPFALHLDHGPIIEGVIDLAYRDRDGPWTLIDFKTDADLGERLGAYQRQLAWYAYALEQLTGAPARAILLLI